MNSILLYNTPRKLRPLQKIGSRRVIQWAALIMVIQGVISKFGAIFIMVPDPVVGGIFCVMFGMITAFGWYTDAHCVVGYERENEMVFHCYRLVGATIC